MSQFIPPKKLRRIDHFSRMAMLAVGRAFENKDLASLDHEKTGLIVASGYGAAATTFAFLDSYMDKGDALAFPIHFSNSVHNAAAAHISIAYDIQGPNLTVSQFDFSFISALISAQSWLQEGKADSIIVVTSDEYCQVMGYCAQHLKNDTRPFSFAESATCFWLKKQPLKDSCYGWFEDPVIGNYLADDLKMPKDAQVVISPSFIQCSPDPFLKHLAPTSPDDLNVRHHCSSPTDHAMDAALCLDSPGKTCLIKLNEATGYGMVTYIKKEEA